jgi:hypothetical protein
VVPSALVSISLVHPETHQYKAEHTAAASTNTSSFASEIANHAETADRKPTTPAQDKDASWQSLKEFVQDNPKEWQRMLEDGTVASGGKPTEEQQ